MSVPFTAARMLEWTRAQGGELLQGDPERALDAVSTDTRTLGGKATLFVALRGEHHDAHDHLDAAVKGGAGALLVERLPEGFDPDDAAIPVVRVTNSTEALGSLAAGHRAGFAGPVVAITGSNGKTSTKELCHAVLARSGRCLKNRGNWNNAIGLPLTLLEREADHETLVVEVGTNHPGEIAALAAIAQATIGVFTNVGTAHIEFLGSREGIAHEKGALLESLPEDGVAVVNADDALVMSQLGRTRARVSTFGRTDDADVSARNVAARGAEGFGFELRTPAGSREVVIGGLGDHAVINALAAAAASLAAGASLDDVAGGLAVSQAVDGRMQPHDLAGGITVLDDSYNASPQSVESALRSLTRLKGAGRGIAVLGAMGELGEEAVPAHRAIGRLSAELGIEVLVVRGDERADVLADAAREHGMEAARVHVCRELDEAADRVLDLVAPGDWVLVKGSRAMKMERIVGALREAKGAA